MPTKKPKVTTYINPRLYEQIVEMEGIELDSQSAVVEQILEEYFAVKKAIASSTVGGKIDCNKLCATIVQIFKVFG